MNKEYYVQGENLLISDENGKLRMTSYTSSSKKILESQNRIEIFQNEIQQHALQIKEKLEQIRKSKLNSALWVIGAFFSMGFAIYGIPYFSKFLESMPWPMATSTISQARRTSGSAESIGLGLPFTTGPII